MRIHIITIGEPKLPYAKNGWNEYCKRLKRFHQLRVSHLADKYADSAKHILGAAGNAYIVALEIKGQQYDSIKLAVQLDKLSLLGREVCFVIGGPDGLPGEVTNKADLLWSLSELTLPHDLAMVVLTEALYRASSINAGLPYHRE